MAPYPLKVRFYYRDTLDGGIVSTHRTMPRLDVQEITRDGSWLDAAYDATDGFYDTEGLVPLGVQVVGEYARSMYGGTACIRVAPRSLATFRNAPAVC